MDTYTEHNPDAPWNHKETETLSELEEQRYKIIDLEEKLRIKQQCIDYKIWQLKKLAEFEECIRTFGSLTYEQQTEKNEILNQYIK